MTDAQIYWNGRGRAQCLKISCGNNRGIGYTSTRCRNDHIRRSHGIFDQPRAGDRKYSTGNMSGPRLLDCRKWTVLRDPLYLHE